RNTAMATGGRRSTSPARRIRSSAARRGNRRRGGRCSVQHWRHSSDPGAPCCFHGTGLRHGAGLGATPHGRACSPSVCTGDHPHPPLGVGSGQDRTGRAAWDAMRKEDSWMTLQRYDVLIVVVIALTAFGCAGLRPAPPTGPLWGFFTDSTKLIAPRANTWLGQGSVVYAKSESAC